MTDTVLTEFPVLKSADVAVAARKGRVLAALANIDRSRRVRFAKALTETCRGLIALGGLPNVVYRFNVSDSQSTIEAIVQWSEPATRPEEAGTTSAPGDEDAPDIALRRVGEMLDGFSLDNWPGVGATVTLQMNAPPGLVVTEDDVTYWSGLLDESQVEEVVRQAEQQRRLLASELQSSLQQEELLAEVGGEATETGLVTMLSLVASKTDNGVAILDGAGQIVWVNDSFTTHCGYETGQCSGRRLDELLAHADTDANALQALRDGLESTTSVYVEMLVRRSTGDGCWSGINLTPVFEADDTVGRWIVLMRDVTQQRETQDVLTAARDAAEQASRSKSEFLANMSHEIRTPMNAIIGMTELALGTELSSEQQEYLSTVKMSAESLLELLNDILDLSKIEAGRIELDEIDFDLADVVRDALKSLAVKAHAKELELATRLPMDLPHHLHGDPLRLRQILINLVGNAIKFTERGEVVVEFSTSDGDKGSSGGTPELQFSVRDTGIGIPAERIDRIFEAFTQVDASTTRQFGGTGLGLTITAELLRLMGGQIRVESEVGVGSTFHVSIPLQLAGQQPLPIQQRVAGSREQLEGRTVLVVDDNATNRRILDEMLTNWGLRPRVTDGADAALKELEAAAYYDRPFDLLIIDAMMPDIDGFDLIEQIGQRNDIASDAVMMLSSADRADSSRRCRDLGVASYLVKPVSQSGLLDAIVSLIGGNDAACLEAPPAAARTSADDTALVPLSILIADDHEANRVLAAKILEKRGHTSTHAANGRRVLEQLENESFDLILMDVQMPELDGLQTTAAIRTSEESTGRHIPIVALTAHAMKGDREKCLAAGMDAYLPKPLRGRELIALVEKLCEPVTAARIGTSAARQETSVVDAKPVVACGTNASQPQPTTDESIDFSGALDRMDGDKELLIEQMRFFLQDAPELLSGMAAAIEAEDGGQLRQSAHRLKGLLNSYDMSAAADLCLQLEFVGRDGVNKGAVDLVTQLRPRLDTLLEEMSRFVADHDAS